MTRRKTPNVLGDLMGEEPEERQQTSKPVNQQDSKTAKRQAVKPLRQRLASEDKTKVTLYLSPDTAFDLDGAKLQLRRLVKPDNLKDVTKSSIAEAALILALQDLEAQGEESAIARELRKAVRQ
jgi:hypothetical protein